VSSQKVERLMRLLQVLLDTETPLTSRELRVRVPGYSEDDVAFRRAFERDKAELGNLLGHPLRPEPVTGTDPPADGYRLRPSDAYLRDPGLTPEERRALAVAASAVRLAGVDPHRAASKVGADQGEADGGTGSAELPAGKAVVALFQAVADRREAEFTYRGEARRVQPLRLRFAKGRWYLSAFDTGRGAERLFRLDRLDSDVTIGSGDAFAAATPSAPDQLDEPWALGEGAPVEVRVRVDAERADAARRAAPSVLFEEDSDGSVTLTLPVRNGAALRSFVLGFVDGAEIIDPPEARADIVRWLEAVAGEGR